METRMFLIRQIVIIIALTGSLNAQVIQEWAARYEPITNDRAVAIAVDKDGNVYVTGYNPDSITTAKYSSSGVHIWVRNVANGNGLHQASDIVTDAAGNVYVTGWGSEDYITVKYNTLGVQQWVKIQSRSTDRAYDIALDKSGNIYVTGTSEAPSLTAVMSFKYDPNGNMLWQAIYDDPVGTPYGYSLGIDDSSNVYIAGKTIKSSDNLSNYLLIKYNSSGSLQWISEYDGPYKSNDNGKKIAIDGYANSYVTGDSYDSVSRWDYATVKFNTNGVKQWERRYDDEYGNDDYTNAIVLDNSGNVIVTGYSQNNVVNFDYLTVKYKPDGTEVWKQRYNGPGNGYDVPYAVAVDSLGNVYVTGESWGGSGSFKDFSTLKYKSSGNLSWEMRYVGPLNTDVSSSIAVDSSRNVYVTGYSSGTTTLFDYCTIKYSQPLLLPSVPALFSPPNGAILVVTNPLLDWGTSLYAESYNVQVSADSSFTNTVYDSSNILVTEFQIPENGLNINTTYYWRISATNLAGTSPWSTVRHFTTVVTGISENNGIPKKFRLYNNYPNPFNPVTRIKFDIPKSAFVKVIIYNVLGKEVATLVNESLKPGKYERIFDAIKYPSGVYFYKITSGDFSAVKKMVVIK